MQCKFKLKSKKKKTKTGTKSGLNYTTVTWVYFIKESWCKEYNEGIWLRNNPM